MEKKKKDQNFKQERTHIYNDKRIDVYREKQKYREPTQCPDCGAIYKDGRWKWDEVPHYDNKELCPACKRIRDKYPAGYVTLSGQFFEDHRPEIMNMIKFLEKTESREHPLERIMETLTDEEKIVISTTGMHLPRRLGDALKNAYKGELDISYDAESYIRVNWNR